MFSIKNNKLKNGTHHHHHALPPQSSRSLHNLKNSISSSNNNRNRFLTRLRCLLGFIMMIMASTVFFMFRMAHSTDFFSVTTTNTMSNDKNHNSPNSQLSRNRPYSIYKTNKNKQNNNKATATTRRTTIFQAEKASSEKIQKQKKKNKEEEAARVSELLLQKTTTTKKKQKESPSAGGGVGTTTTTQTSIKDQPEEHSSKKIKLFGGGSLRSSDEEEAEGHSLFHQDLGNFFQKRDKLKKLRQQEGEGEGSEQQQQQSKKEERSTLRRKKDEQQQKRDKARKEAIKEANVLDEQKKNRGGSATQHKQKQKQKKKGQQQQEESSGAESKPQKIAHGFVDMQSLKASLGSATLAPNYDWLTTDNENENDGAAGGTTTTTKNSKHRLTSEQREQLQELYKSAVGGLKDPQIRQDLDPLFINSLEQNGDTTTTTTTTTTDKTKLYRVPYKPKVEYLGVLVDAGRHYFPIGWWKQLIVYLYQLRFNLIQFRLTDDQTFNIQLKSYPQLANPVLLRDNVDKRTYTRQEIQELVQFAKYYDIRMVPEINVPGHAGGWAGIPGLVVMCPQFICTTGYGLALDIEHPNISTILSKIFQEIIELFDDPPFFHLGGDEVNMADHCFEEVGRRPFNYTNFEIDIQNILTQQLGYPNEKVVRWERTGQSLDLERAGLIEHYWENLPNVKYEMPKLPNGDYKPWFASKGLYFDTNHQDDGYAIHRNTYSAMNLKGIPKPTAVVAGTFELGVEFWRQRNVATRLISVAMGAAQFKVNGKMDWLGHFNETCHDLGIDSRWCDLQGATATVYKKFMDDHRHTWSAWKEGLCERLTTQELRLQMREQGVNAATGYREGCKNFWQSFGDEIVSQQDLPVPKGVEEESNNKNNYKKKNLGDHAVPLTGVIFDMVNSMRSPPSRIEDLLRKFVAPLGFKLLQLRLVDDSGFGIKLEGQPKLGYSAMNDVSGDNPAPTNFPLAAKEDDAAKRGSKFKKYGIPTAQQYRELVSSVWTELGMQIIPEVSFSTNAGGWIHSGLASRCPNTLCDEGSGVVNGIANSDLLPVVYSVLREIRQIFATTPFIHLGHDNRLSASRHCLKEARNGGNFAADPMEAFSEFEEKLSLLAFMIGIEPENIIRWNNEEDKRYSDRVGHITHYKASSSGQVPKPRPGEEVITTIDLMSNSPWDIYKQTRDLVALQPKGILGEIRDISQKALGNINVGLRLVAFALGLQQQQDITKGVKKESDFEKLLVQTCKQVKLEGCDEPYQSNNDDTSSYEVDSSRYKDKLCNDFTYNQLARVARKELTRLI